MSSRTQSETSKNEPIEVGVDGDVIIEERGQSLRGDAKKIRESPTKFQDVYETDERLRSGSFGTVYTCRHKKCRDTVYAVKILDRTKLKKKDDDAVFREVEILKELHQVEHVVQLIDFFVEPKSLFMVQVYAAGGDVFDRLGQRSTYTEKDARDFAKILLETVNQLHSVKPHPIVHRDLKPENLLLENKLSDTCILLGDFGFARHVDPAKGCKTRCGTPAFVAPEVILGLRYDEKVDLWSIGVIIYMLICGYAPFSGSNHRALFRKVRAGDFVFHEAYWKNVSIEAKQLISNLLTVTADKRWTAARALEGDWFLKQTADSLRENDLSGSLSEIKRIKPRQRWKSAYHAITFCSTAPFWSTDAVTFSQQMSSWDKAAASSGSTEKGSAWTAASAALSAASTGQELEHIMSKLPRINFSELYELKTKLRKGSFATVWECVHKQSGDRFAVKIIQRKGLQAKDDEAVLNEVAIMQSLSANRYTICLMDFFEEEDNFYMVMEYAAGGDVFDKIVQKTHYTEKDARDLCVVLLKAVAGLHKAGIAHRDIKPQNLLLMNRKDDSAIKISDFGFARRVHTLESLTQRVGTPTYVAPEILKNIPHDQRVDLWSVGVVIFVLLVGYPPFLEEDQAKLFEKIRTADWKFDDFDWKHVSKDAKDLIRGLLVVDPKDRWSVEEALRCRWIQQDPNRLSSVSLTNSLCSLKEKKNFLRATRAFMWGKDLKPMDICTQAQDTPSGQINVSRRMS